VDDTKAMNSVFLLWHVHESAGRDDNEKLIGVYASRSDAEAAIQRLRNQPWFAKYPDGFTIDEYEIGKDHWAEGFVTT
jgi:hypothetical protein